MALGHSPKIVTNGLVSYWDAANTNRSARGYKNLLDLSDWTLGTGSTATYTLNGTVAENQRILDTGPFGVSTLVWDSPSNDATSDADGGFISPIISIDSSQLYRFSVWLRRKNIGDGSYYVGTYGFNSSGVNEGVLLRANTQSVGTNPYFSAGGWPASIANNEWMLVVGHIFPAGSGTGSVHADSGLWNTSGTKFQAPNQGDWVWQSTNTKTYHRAYLYYSTITTTNQQFYQPRIDLCNGSQPTIAELVAGVGSEWYDMIGSNHGSIVNSAQLYNSGGYMTFDGVDDYVLCPYQSYMTKSGNYTFSAWIKTTTSGVIFQNCNNDGNDRNGMVSNSGTGVTFGYFNGTAWVQVYAPINSGQWNHVVGVNSGGTLTLYTNGVASTTVSGSMYVHIATGLYLGRQTLDETNKFNGNIANITTYSRALSAAEVTQNFNALRGRFGI